jgi:hypothetical protein
MLILIISKHCISIYLIKFSVCYSYSLIIPAGSCTNMALPQNPRPKTKSGYSISFYIHSFSFNWNIETYLLAGIA